MINHDSDILAESSPVPTLPSLTIILVSTFTAVSR